MKIGPKYKIARRLGAPIFEKTQTQKFALRAERKGKTRKFLKPKSEYGLQLNEKQKARFIYGLTEKQFSNYVKKSLEKKPKKPAQVIFEKLEKRLDNVVWRSGFTTTRRGARQMVSHGHITLNGKKVTIPSIEVKIGDVVGIREGSANKGIFANFDEGVKNVTVPSWITSDVVKRTATITGAPQLEGTDTMFDLNVVIEFYSR